MNSQESRSEAAVPEQPRIDIGSEIIEYDDRPDECTLFPRSVGTRDERMTVWLTARGDAFVDAREHR
jgi:hypothetical protein